ncbi:anthrone oxygenase family protein [Kutzneria sp. CA-103260]|uniref:anthrone oxygenase family protein n=1 Tax=Kutzneria sp. CA-103260 TaxID=2802641 RepID=UPI001BADB9FD|nr:anthrone oxygenase family protein [Kutzneria sp. CA-103260]QUQ66006.1 hypothetical protein JJ691_37310 [Kutzneria sp. CA-103260]
MKTAELLSIVLNALVMGVFWGPWVALTRSLATFEPSVFLAIGRRLNLNLAPLMTVLMPVALLSTVPTLVLSYGDHPTTFATTLAGAALFAVALVVTVAVEVPIAVQIKTWSTDTMPEDWQRLRDRWASVHVIRVLAGVIGLGLLVFGAICGP